MKKKLGFYKFVDDSTYGKLVETTVIDSPSRKKLVSSFYVDSTEDTSDLIEAFSMIRRDCPASLASFLGDGLTIYRGMSGQEWNKIKSFYKVDYSKGTRSAENTNDNYRMLIDTNPNLSEYPKRSKSMIATNDIEYATHYGFFYVVFPFSNAKIGVTETYDIFENRFDFLGVNVNVNEFSKFIEFGLDEEFKLNIGRQRTLESLKSGIESGGGIKFFIKKMQKVFEKGMRYHERDEDIFVLTPEDLCKKYNFHDTDSFLNYIWDDVLNETNLKFSLKNGSSFYSSYSNDDDTECWISGDCYMLGPYHDSVELSFAIDELKIILNESFES